MPTLICPTRRHSSTSQGKAFSGRGNKKKRKKKKKEPKRELSRRQFLREFNAQEEPAPDETFGGVLSLLAVAFMRHLSSAPPIRQSAHARFLWRVSGTLVPVSGANLLLLLPGFAHPPNWAQADCVSKQDTGPAARAISGA